MVTAPTAARVPTEPPTIHEATRALDGSDVVFSGPVIDMTTAVARRQANLDVVIRGDDIDRNRALAQAIERAVGPYQRGTPHLSTAGPHALPHYQQDQPPPDGHTFYETGRRKARKQP